MGTAFEFVPGFTQVEADFIDHSFRKTAQQLRERGCEPGWIVEGAMRASLETMVTLPQEEQLDFMDSFAELMDALRDVLVDRRGL